MQLGRGVRARWLEGEAQVVGERPELFPALLRGLVPEIDRDTGGDGKENEYQDRECLVHDQAEYRGTGGATTQARGPRIRAPRASSAPWLRKPA